MTSPPCTCTRRMSKSHLSSHGESNSSPTATQNMAQESPDQITKISEKEGEEITFAYRQTSLIPAYRHRDTIDDLELENFLGTPYTCEREEALAKRKLAKKKRNKVNPIAKNVEQLQNKEDSFAPPSTASPPWPTAAEKYNALSVKIDDDSSELRAYMEAMTLGKPSLSSYITNDTSNEVDNWKEDSSEHLQGITGSHIRFSPRNKIYLRGVPQPTGTHTTFEEE